MDSLGAVHKTILAIIIVCMCWMLAQFHVEAAELNTKLPVESDAEFSVPITIDIPSQPLAAALNQLGKSTNLNIAFPSDLVLGKTSPAVKGRMSRKEALQRILANSGLTAKMDAGNAYIERASNDEKNIQLDTINVRAKRFYEVGPLPGLGLTKEQIPGNVQSITAKEIKDSHSLSITDLMNKKLQSVTVNDYQGNPFQMDVQYRGFTAGPQIGTPQGLSVFFDGIRVNEPFGDVVNWDMIPMNAISSFDVFPGSNPIFGLGTLGGAVSVKTKDGFNNAGVDAEVLTGSFGRKQLQAEGGWNNGTIGLFAAGNFFLEDGWRDNSPSKVNQLFTKASYRGDKLDLSLNTLFVTNDLVGNGLLPSQEYARDPTSVFTSPDTTKNKLAQIQLSGNYFVNDNFTITGQVYRRNSKRKAQGADVYTEYGNTAASRNMDAGDQYTCLYNSTNAYGLPDYYVLKIPTDIFSHLDVNDPLYLSDNQVKFFVDTIFGNGVDLSLLPSTAKNEALDDDYLKFAQQNFKNQTNPRAYALYVPQAAVEAEITPPAFSGGGALWAYAAFQQIADPNITDPVDVLTSFANNYYITDNGDGTGTYNILLTERAQNADACALGQTKYQVNATGGISDLNPDGTTKQYDGAQFGGAGLVEGVPTAVITNTEIDQMVDGASLQLNWNLEKHKFMVGASIDSASAEYGSGQRLGFFDAKRKAYLDPNQALDVFAAADTEIRNNDFDGTSTTKSLYFSETWSPVETFHLTGSARINHTQIKNTIATRSYGFFVGDLHQYTSDPDNFNICRPGDPCITGYKIPDLASLSNPPETEKFTYKSFNPSLGATWQANENLNIYGNFAQGARTPSVIELGCALDKTLVDTGRLDGNGNPIKIFKSIAENRSCSLPSTLSGDPHLPQIKATTFDIGMRGTFTSWLGLDNLEWNLGAYRTNLKDDIYLVTFPGNRSFFDTIGKTRRQGIEAGLSWTHSKASFKLNYALTDATFQDSFEIASNDNSSAVPNQLLGESEAGEFLTRSITVKPGNRMPGVPLHNLNASVSYDVTDKWQIGFGAVMHSKSFVRGNENNRHRQGVTTFETSELPGGGQVIVARQPTNNPGTVPGFAVFNFSTRYKFNSEWTLGLQVNNIFDREYFSAGRLGINPFSPSINGAIGPDGYNHNSFDWLSTNFIAPGAPRAAWFSLNWQFDPNKK